MEFIPQTCAVCVDCMEGLMFSSTYGKISVERKRKRKKFDCWEFGYCTRENNLFNLDFGPWYTNI